MTVQQLRNNGYKVKVLHNRLYNGSFALQVANTQNMNGPIYPDTKGGSTEIIIDSPSGEHFHGIAICSRKENYDKKLGVRIAIGRCGL